MGFFQLRYLQTLNSIAAEHNSTIIFPMPISMFSGGSISSMFRGKKDEDDDS
jgi:hypothetical protein